MGDRQRLERVLLDEQDRRPLGVDLLDDREDLLDEDRARGPATARRGAGAAAATSAPGRWPASAARRPTACRPAGADRSRSRGNRVMTRSRSRSDAPFWSRVNAPIWRFSRTVSREKIRRPSGAWPMPASTSSWAARLRDVLAVEADRCPARGWSRPEIVLRVVVLPAPLAPISVTISPRSTSIVMPCRAWIWP